MRKLLLILPLALALVLPFVAAAAQQVDTAALNQLQLAPSDATVKQYLNIKSKAPFVLSDVGADFTILEIFSMYCPICQGEAPHVNKVYEAIENNPKLKGKVKVIGIGVGNTPLEVDIFRKKYNIKFPLFPDDAIALQKSFSEPLRTPTFITLRKNGNKAIEVVAMHVGKIRDVSEFLKEMLPGI